MNLHCGKGKRHSVVYKLIVALFVFGMCFVMNEYVYADEIEVVDVEIKLSDLLDEESILENVSTNNSSYKGVEVKCNLLDSNSQKAVEVVVNFDYSYSDGNSVRIDSINSAKLTSYGYFEALWNGNGTINNSTEASYTRQFIVHNRVTDGRMIYRFTLIIDIYGDFDYDSIFIQGY